MEGVGGQQPEDDEGEAGQRVAEAVADARGGAQTSEQPAHEQRHADRQQREAQVEEGELLALNAERH